jgi:hypothetical protein
MKEVADKVDKKDSENKKWIAGMAALTMIAVTSVVVGLASTLGGNTHVESIDSEENSED